MKYLIMICAALLSAQAMAKTYVTSSSSIDLCANYSAQKAANLEPAAGVNLNSFDFGYADEVLEIPVELESLQAFNISPAISNTFNIEPVLGTLELHPSGALYYKGQKIGSTSLEEACAYQGGKPIFGREKQKIEGDTSYE